MKLGRVLSISRLLIIAFALITLRGFTQVIEYGVPEKLSASVNTEAEESLPLLSFDGKVLFFTRSLSDENVGGRYTGSDIWGSERTEAGWKRAENRKHSFNTKSTSAMIGMKATGDVLYLMKTSSSRNVKGIYFSKLVNNVWASPELIPIKGIERNGFVGFYVSPDFDVIFISMKGLDTRGEEDIYVCVKSPAGEWSVPKNLGSSINSKGFEIAPFLSTDKTKLYFSSNGHPGLGDADIFVSERLYGSWDVWSVPQNLGKVINSEKFDAYFSMYGDSVCYFASNRESSSTNIFSAKVDIDDGSKSKQKIESIVSEARTLLDDVRNSSQSVSESTPSSVTVFYNDNSPNLLSSSQKEFVTFSGYLKSDPAKKVILKYDGTVINGSKSLQMINQERIRQLKQMLKSAGVVESRIIVSPDFFSSDSIRIRSNCLKLIAE